jgi:hypothetical protein
MEAPNAILACETGIFFFIIRIVRAFLIEEVKLIKKLQTQEKSGKKKRSKKAAKKGKK